MDADCDSVGVVYDIAGFGIVLWRPSARAECALSADALFCDRMSGFGPMGRRSVQHCIC